MTRYEVRCAGVVIGHTELEGHRAGERQARGAFHPAPEFQRRRELLDQYHDASRAAEQQAHTLEERRRFQELVEETLGFHLLAPDGRRVGRVLALSDVAASPEQQWEVRVLLDETAAHRGGGPDRRTAG